MSDKLFTIQNGKIFDSQGRCQGRVDKEMIPSFKWATCPHCGDPVPKYSFYKHIKHCSYGIGFKISKIDRATRGKSTTRRVVKSAKKVAEDKSFGDLLDLAADLNII